MRRLLTVILLCSPVFAQTPSSMVVTAQWLAARLGHPDIVVVHVGPDRKQYDSGHIPYARHLALGDIAVTKNGIANELAPVAQLKRAFEAAGVSDTARVILYSENGNLYAARAWWTLDYLGHASHAALLDGSLDEWQEEKNVTTTEEPAPAKATLTPHLRPEVLATMADVEAVTKKGAATGVTLLDARPPEQFSGAEAGEEITRPGHIPGAVNIFWVNTLESRSDPQLRPMPELRKIFREAGVSGTRAIIYCRSGMQSSYLYFVARFLGMEATMYDGSFLEWSNASSNPVEKSPSPQ